MTIDASKLADLVELATDIKRTFDADEEVASADAAELAEKVLEFAKTLQQEKTA